MARLHLFPLGTPLDGPAAGEGYWRGAAPQLAALDQARAVAVAGGGPRGVQRVHRQGKLTARERVSALLDEGSPFHELGTLVNHGVVFAEGRTSPGAGVVTGLGKVHDRWVVVIANDNTLAAGSWWPGTPEKIQRAQEVGLRLHLPVVYLVESSGLFLPEQARSFPGGVGAGHIFKRNAELAAAGVPQLAGVFGASIAGGGYKPIISDRVVMTEAAYMVIAGAALVKGAKARQLTSLDIGGPEVHVHQSGCADLRVPTDEAALLVLREEVSRLPSSAVGWYRAEAEAAPPRFSPRELPEVFPKDFRRSYEIEQVLARLVDSSLFHEFLPDVGREIVTGVGRISGLWVAFAGNRQGMIEEPGAGIRPGGALYREGIAKLSAFARAASEDGLPLVWLQDVAGFDIGEEAERLGLLGYGSSLIYSISTPQNPVFTVLLRKASGAGYYAMAGMPYDPVLQLATPLTRLAVMEGRTLATAAFTSKLDDQFRPLATEPDEVAALEAQMEAVAQRIEADMDPLMAASRRDVDEVIHLGELRDWLVCLAESAWQATGHRRVRNPRIWSLHDLEALWRVK
ncbi:MAG: propionyl-CoA carboxylase [Deltaproteobacteria bacterium]|nr:propionyl-CoA carboxylase [Deltaproteobacteria bacterium]